MVIRLKVVRNPLSEEKMIVQYRRLSVFVIWTVAVVVSTMPAIFVALEVKDGVVYMYKITFYAFKVFPVIVISIMWGLLMWTAKAKRNQIKSSPSNISESIEVHNSRKMAVIIRRLVILTLVFWIPYLVWITYVWIVITQNNTDQV